MKHLMTGALLVLMSLNNIYAQISGSVTTIENGKTLPLPGASVFWQGSDIGTITDEHGHFHIEKPAAFNQLVVSFIGYETQSKIIISRKGEVNFQLKPSGSELQSVDVVGKVDATMVDLKKADLTYRIDDKELRKAACCNLSESFETNASVDVSFTDAVTGQRQIEMLGLAGKYALIQRENIPFARGLNANSGLTYIPGPFVEGIQLTKGLSSVVNGYEGLTGQINVEYYKPESAPKLMANAFVNQGARTEFNLIANAEPEGNGYAGILAHGSIVPFAQDNNNDGFADMPLRQQINLMPRWHWRSKNSHWEGQVGVSYIDDHTEGGQMSYLKEGTDSNLTNWGFNTSDRRTEAFGKTGYMFDHAHRSLGIIYNFSNHQRQATFGNFGYNALQNSVYLNTIYQDEIGTSEKHKYRTGISVQADWISEELYDSENEIFPFVSSRNEVVPGAFYEYTFEPDVRTTLVAGMRGDYNLYYDKFYLTPRMHLRHQVSENTTLRIGGGRGQRTANVIGENLNILASSRDLNFNAVDSIMPEIGWNAGASITQNLFVGEKRIGLTVDAFYTWFKNKLITDLDFSTGQALFLYGEGSRAFSLMGQVDYELIKNLDLRLAYKYLDSREQFIDGLRTSYLIPTHRAFVNMAYETENQWKFDLTVNWFGEKRLPSTRNSPLEFQQPENSPGFFTVNTQINKVLKGGWEVFAGVDNLLNFKQSNPIVDAENASDPDSYFDTNFTWGPVFGRNIYLGVYWQLESRSDG